MRASYFGEHGHIKYEYCMNMPEFNACLTKHAI